MRRAFRMHCYGRYGPRSAIRRLRKCASRSPMRMACPARNCSARKTVRASRRYTRSTAGKRKSSACSARRPTCSTASASGARTGSTSSTARWRIPYNVRNYLLVSARRIITDVVRNWDSSHAEGIGLRHPADALRVERAHGPGALEPAVLVELPRQHRLEVMAGELGLRPVDHADGALEPRLHELLAHLGVGTPRERQQERGHRRVAALALVALGMRRPHLLHLHRLVPV